MNWKEESIFTKASSSNHVASAPRRRTSKKTIACVALHLLGISVPVCVYLSVLVSVCIVVSVSFWPLHQNSSHPPLHATYPALCVAMLQVLICLILTNVPLIPIYIPAEGPMHNR